MRALLGPLIVLLAACGNASRIVPHDPSEDSPKGRPIPAPAPEGCVQDVTAGTRDYACGGLRFRATIAASCLTRACGLIVDVHGRTMNAEMEEANTRLAARASERGYLVLQPTATPDPPFSSWNSEPDDENVFQTAQLFARVFHLDMRRMHFTGFSQGGAMTWRMLCRHAEFWGSIAPAAGDGCPFSPEDRPSREVPTLFLFGTHDLYGGYDRNAVPQRNAVIIGWGMPGGEAIISDPKFKRTRWTSTQGTEFEMLEHEYEGKIGGHCVPGSTDDGSIKDQVMSYACDGPDGFDWGAEALAWFESHPPRVEAQ